MKYLYIGSQTEERFQMLLSLTRIASEDVIDALRDHLVNGATESNAAALNKGEVFMSKTQYVSGDGWYFVGDDGGCVLRVVMWQIIGR